MSSGNLTADRRFAYAQDLRRAGDFAAAADLIAQALELVPDWMEGRYAHAEALMEAGNRTAAAEAFRRYLILDSADSLGAALKLAQMGAAPVPAAMPAAFVRRLFDDYAASFDRALVESLHYVGPQLLKTAVEACAAGRRFAQALDLGCGTGLAGAALRSCVDRLEGVDLSPRMAAEANAKNVYDAVTVRDIGGFLATAQRTYDLVTAADVFCYFGDLTPVFGAVRRVIAAGGLFAFTLQRRDDGLYALGEERRFGHSRAYVLDTAARTGFTAAAVDDVVLRKDGGADVPGLVAVLTPAAP